MVVVDEFLEAAHREDRLKWINAILRYLVTIAIVMAIVIVIAVVIPKYMIYASYLCHSVLTSGYR